MAFYIFQVCILIEIVSKPKNKFFILLLPAHTANNTSPFVSTRYGRSLAIKMIAFVHLYYLIAHLKGPFDTNNYLQIIGRSHLIGR